MMFAVSCSGLLKKKGEDAGVDASVVTEAADAAPVPEPGPAALATNEGDIARFPDETKLPDVGAVLQRAYNVREAPPAGAVVAALSKGTAVTQIAQRRDSYLVTFDDAKAPGTKRMGWIHKDAFSAIVADAGPLTCPKGEVLVLVDTQLCAKVCGDDSACPKGQACKGQANKLLPSGKAGDVLSICTAFQGHDAGVPPAIVDAGKPDVTDAGHPAVVDAGKPAAVDAGKPAAVDAGPPPPKPTGPDVIPAGASGACPAGFVKVEKTGKCHRSCAGGASQAERLKHCGNANPLCIKCDKDEKKVCADSQDQCRAK
jgi:hypothetical protein